MSQANQRHIVAETMQSVHVHYRQCHLAGPQRRSLRHDKQQWIDQIASTGENHLLCGEIKDAFASFRRLRQKCKISSAALLSMSSATQS